MISQNGYDVTVNEKPATERSLGVSHVKLFFVNLGGYKPDAFDEFYYKLIIPATDKGEAIAAAKKTAFFQHFSFSGHTRMWMINMV